MEELENKDLSCPLCKSKLEYDEQYSFWRCPRCWTEIWPDEFKLKEIKQEIKSKQLEQQMRKALKHSIYPEPLPPVPIINPNKRSSNKSGRSRKKPIKKLKPYELI